jgi:hypothetical protein
VAERARGLPLARRAVRPERTPRTAGGARSPRRGERGVRGVSGGGFNGFEGLGGERGVLEPIALSSDGDGLGVMEEAVEDGAGGGNVLEQLAPVFERAVAGHDGGAGFVAAHDDFQEVLAGVFGELLEAHVIDDEQIGFEILTQPAVALGERFFGEEIGDQIEDRPIAHEEALLDRFVADRLRQVGLADAGGADEEHVGGLADKVPGRQLVELLARDRGIEPPIEVLKAFERGKLGGDGATRDFALFADVDLVVEDQLQELAMREPVGRGFLEPDGEGLAEAREAQLLEGDIEVHGWERASRL